MSKYIVTGEYPMNRLIMAHILMSISMSISLFYFLIFYEINIILIGLFSINYIFIIFFFFISIKRIDFLIIYDNKLIIGNSIKRKKIDIASISKIEYYKIGTLNIFINNKIDSFSFEIDKKIYSIEEVLNNLSFMLNKQLFIEEDRLILY